MLREDLAREFDTCLRNFIMNPRPAANVINNGSGGASDGEEGMSTKNDPME